MPAPAPSVQSRRPSGPFWLGLELFILVMTGLSVAGWSLSLAGKLNAASYGVVLAVGAFAIALWLRCRLALALRFRRLHFRKNRWRRPLPLIFAAIFACAALGGALYPPNNFDALTYRVPPVLHWLDAGHWHWITTANSLFNTNPPGFAWWMAPLVALTRSDRAFFLLNLAAFATMPAAFFLVLRGCGVPRRVAWFWMWLLPSGYCYALQAGGIGNDLLPAAYLLGAVALAFRGRSTGDVSALWLSVLAAALATGVKIIALPLGLVWLVAIAPAWRLLLRPATALVAAGALAISYVPTAALNLRHTGDWSGDPTNHYQIHLASPAVGFAGNALQLVINNAAPALWPAPGAANRVFDHLEKSDAGRALKAAFPRFDLDWGELAIEETAGLGAGLMLLALLSTAAAILSRKTPPRAALSFASWISLAAFAGALVFCATVGSESTVRLAAPFYPFLLVPLLRFGANETLARQRWWRVVATLAAASILPALILSPARPLWPAQTLLAKIDPPHPALQRARLVYATYAQRHDYLASLKSLLPPHTRTLGFVPSVTDLQTTLWTPYGEHRVVEIIRPVRDDASVHQLRGSFLLTTTRALSERFQLLPDAFCAAIGGRIIAKRPVLLIATFGPEEALLIAVD